MELATITMDKVKARKAYLEYRNSVRERHSREDEEIMRGYLALARGQQLIRLSDTLRAGGTKKMTLRHWARDQVIRVPKLGVSRADAEFVWSRGINRDGGIEFTMRHPDDLHITNRRDRIRVAARTFAAAERASFGAVRAMVPNVPPGLRPAHHLRNYRVLFEAEWAQDPRPPVDPALIKRISGDLYAVVAVWNLTELERAVLAGRTVG